MGASPICTAPRFAYLHGAEFLGDLAVLEQILVDIGTRRVVLLPAHDGDGEAVGQPLALAYVGDDILAEPVHAHPEPKAHDVLDLFAHGGIVVIEIGLLHREQMQVVLPSLLVKLPAGTGEGRHPVVGRALSVLALAGAPDVIVLILGIARRRLLEPLVLIGSVVDDEVHDDLHPPLVRAVQHRLEILHGSVVGIYRPIVRDVVAEILLRRCVERREPYRVHPEALYVIEFAEHPFEIAYPVAVAVAKAPRPDLIDRKFLVPRFFHDFLL